ncbi:MAG: nitrate ABC transporter permease [Armatimonadetes bacterium]|nr:nitrate ABC transporter permease [Armatimonadota bacterium]MBS1726315.1 nitrate ABC transporter permease [Armatimonadota bacterium]
MPRILDAFLPNKSISQSTFLIIVAFWIVSSIVIWSTSSYKALPKPGEVVDALKDLWFNMGLGQELIKSMALNLKALGLTAVICLLLSYLTVIPFFRPIITAVSKGRFLSLVGFSFVFTLVLGGGSNLKLSLLVFGMSVFFLTSMASVVAEIPKADFDHARTLRMPEWKVVWEVVIRGTFAQAFEVMRQNAAIGWMMLTMVEGIVRSEGGVGAMLLNEQKHFKIPAIFAIQIIILIIGLGQDYVIGFLRRLFCPYSVLTLERK